jgi:CubicO group peptidase (beta-lactamase class C family)
MTEFERTLERLEMELDQGMFTRGAQVTVHVDSERVLDLALGDAGLGAPMTPEHILRVYCTIKPFLAVAVARLVERGAVTLDEPLDARLPGIASLVDGVTLRHVLTHTAGLHTLRGLEMELVQPRAAVRSSSAFAGPSPGGSASTPRTASTAPGTWWGSSSKRSPASRSATTCARTSSSRSGSTTPTSA